MTNAYEVIAAFVDGERVDPGALKLALSEPEGRDYLVDIAALREFVHTEEPAYVGSLAETASLASVWRRRTAWFAATAALVAVAIGATLFITSKRVDRPPTPDHVIKLERGLDWRGN